MSHKIKKSYLDKRTGPLCPVVFAPQGCNHSRGSGRYISDDELSGGSGRFSIAISVID